MDDVSDVVYKDKYKKKGNTYSTIKDQVKRGYKKAKAYVPMQDPLGGQKTAQLIQPSW